MDRLLFFLISLILAGCGSPHQDAGDVVAHVGPYVITVEEFEEGYKNSSYGAQNSLASRRTFLNNMINQKLIMLDAQKRGLDKTHEFLKMIENFWQQSLITAALQEKTREGGDLEKWVDYLRNNTKVEINQEALK